MAKKSDRRLRELEGAVLGVVRDRSPCTAYSVRRAFNESPAHHWQASAGAIYPVMERLERDRLLSSKAVARGRQQTRRYSITALGVSALRAWLVGSENQLLVPPDPLRTRIFFLSALDPEERQMLLRGPLEQLKEHMEVLEEDCRSKKGVDHYAYLAARGAVAVAQARVAWIEEVMRELD